MKTLVLGPQFPGSFAGCIAANLLVMGHEVRVADGVRPAHHRSGVVNWFHANLSRVLSGVEAGRFRKAIQIARRQRPELVLITFPAVPPAVVRELKAASGGLAVCWYADSIANLDRQYLLASPFDAVFSKEPFLVRTLRDKLGVSAHYLPECCDSLSDRRVALTAEDHRQFGCDLAAMGTLHYYRARMLELFEGYDLKIWGANCPPWLSSPIKKYYSRRYVAGTDKARALLSAKIVLTTIHCSEIEGVNGALFQTAGCGAFQIADWMPALPELFEPECEIVTFRTRTELKEKVDYYLARPKERLEISGRAYIRAHREHTYQNRLAKMLDILGFSHKAAAAPEGITTCSG